MGGLGGAAESGAADLLRNAGFDFVQAGKFAAAKGFAKDFGEGCDRIGTGSYASPPESGGWASVRDSGMR